MHTGVTQGHIYTTNFMQKVILNTVVTKNNPLITN